MLEGINVINTEPVMEMSGWLFGIPILVACGIFVLGVIAALIVYLNTYYDVLLILVATVFVATVSGVITYRSLERNEKYCWESEKYVYTVTIDDSVSMNEFNKRYTIVSQEGNIYKIKERK